MRRKDRQITDRTEIEAIISRADVCHLALTDQGQPYVVPLNFGYRDGVLFFHCAHAGRKLEILAENPRVGFALVAESSLVTGEDGCSWTTRYSSVAGSGEARVVEHRKEKEEGLRALMSQYSDRQFTFTDRQIETVTVVRVDISEMSGKSNS